MPEKHGVGLDGVTKVEDVILASSCSEAASVLCHRGALRRFQPEDDLLSAFHVWLPEASICSTIGLCLRVGISASAEFPDCRTASARGGCGVWGGTGTSQCRAGSVRGRVVGISAGMETPPDATIDRPEHANSVESAKAGLRRLIGWQSCGTISATEEPPGA